jgi:hypothetical protein
MNGKRETGTYSDSTVKLTSLLLRNQLCTRMKSNELGTTTTVFALCTALFSTPGIRVFVNASKRFSSSSFGLACAYCTRMNCWSMPAGTWRAGQVGKVRCLPRTFLRELKSERVEGVS